MKQVLVDKLVNKMLDMEIHGADIKSKPNGQILMAYYLSIGVTRNTTMTEWMMGVANKKYPAYGSVTRAIRKAREMNPKWRKNYDQKEQEQENVKKEVGYGRV